MSKEKRTFENISVKKKLLFGFLVSTIIILVIGTLSLISIHTAKTSAILRAELEHQVALIRNVRMHLDTYRLDRMKYRRGIINKEFNVLLKTNNSLVDLLSGEERNKMDSIHTSLKKRAVDIDLYVNNSIVYDSLISDMIKQSNGLNQVLNKDKKTMVTNGAINDKLQWLQTRLVMAKMRAGGVKYHVISNAVDNLSKSLKKGNYIDPYNKSLLLVDTKNSFKEAFENEAILYKKSAYKFPDVVSYTTSLIKQHSKSNAAVLDLIWTLIISIAVIGAVLVYLVSWFTSSSTVRGISTLVEISEHVSKGNIGIIIPNKILKRKDEIGSLTNSFNMMLNQYRIVVDEITSSAQKILETGAELEGSSQSISVSANQQASSLEEVSSTVEEIVSNIQQNSNNAMATKQKAQYSASGLRQLKEQNDKVFESSKDIDAKTKIISEMAFQTNILSLNAAVEAAMAGVNGKSFGVVAAEVKKLAERSKDAATVIEGLTKEGIELTKLSSSLAHKLLPEMEGTNHLVDEIAASSQEQQSGVEQINTALGTLNSVSQENSVRAEQLSANAIYLNQQSNKLKSVIDFFTLNSFQIEEQKGWTSALGLKLHSFFNKN